MTKQELNESNLPEYVWQNFLAIEANPDISIIEKREQATEMLNAFKKAERLAVISEIEKIINPFNLDITAIGEHHPYRNMIIKLNSLKEIK